MRQEPCDPQGHTQVTTRKHLTNVAQTTSQTHKLMTQHVSAPVCMVVYGIGYAKHLADWQSQSDHKIKKQ